MQTRMVSTSRLPTIRSESRVDHSTNTNTGTQSEVEDSVFVNASVGPTSSHRASSGYTGTTSSGAGGTGTGTASSHSRGLPRVGSKHRLRPMSSKSPKSAHGSVEVIHELDAMDPEAAASRGMYVGHSASQHSTHSGGGGGGRGGGGGGSVYTFEVGSGVGARSSPGSSPGRTLVPAGSSPGGGLPTLGPHFGPSPRAMALPQYLQRTLTAGSLNLSGMHSVDDGLLATGYGLVAAPLGPPHPSSVSGVQPPVMAGPGVPRPTNNGRWD